MSPAEGITPGDLMDAMVQADVLEIFVRLPQVDQQRFSSWIDRARDDESRWRRINAFVLALRLGPLQPGPTPAREAATGAAGPEV